MIVVWLFPYTLDHPWIEFDSGVLVVSLGFFYISFGSATARRTLAERNRA
jgi:hypothetical protein